VRLISAVGPFGLQTFIFSARTCLPVRSIVDSTQLYVPDLAMLCIGYCPECHD